MYLEDSYFVGPTTQGKWKEWGHKNPATTDSNNRSLKEIYMSGLDEAQGNYSCRWQCEAGQRRRFPGQYRAAKDATGGTGTGYSQSVSRPGFSNGPSLFTSALWGAFFVSMAAGHASNAA